MKSRNCQWHWILLIALGAMFQALTAIYSVGYFHPDQHFQIIEFSSLQLGQESAAPKIWEYREQIRPTLQIYLFSAYRKIIEFLGSHDPFQQTLILRLAFALFGFALSLGLYWRLTEGLSGRARQVGLMLVLFSWPLPYTRTLFSSEMLASYFFCLALLGESRVARAKDLFWLATGIGILLGLSFLSRFQMGFALVGWTLASLLNRRPIAYWSGGAFGFVITMGLGALLDQQFYGRWVFTPFAYFHENIIAGRAASFGTSTFLVYVGLLMAVLAAPPLSFVYFWAVLKGALSHGRAALTWSTGAFFLGHCLVGHKEERFLFPIFATLPVLAAWGIGFFHEGGTRLARRTLIGLGGLVNVIFLLILTTTPIAQNVAMAERIITMGQGNPQEPVLILYLERTPFQTPSHLPLSYYQQALPTHVSFRRVAANELSSSENPEPPRMFVCLTYAEAMANREALEKNGWEPFLPSSSLIWKINEMGSASGKALIRESWMLYRKSSTRSG